MRRQTGKRPCRPPPLVFSLSPPFLQERLSKSERLQLLLLFSLSLGGEMQCLRGGGGGENRSLLLSIAQEAKDGATSGHAAPREERRQSAKGGVESNTAVVRGAGELESGEAVGKGPLRRRRRSRFCPRARSPYPSLSSSPS